MNTPSATEYNFSNEQLGIARSAIELLHLIIKNPKEYTKKYLEHYAENQKISSLPYQETKIATLLKSISSSDSSADELLPIFRALLKASWQAEDDKLFLLTENKFQEKYLYKLLEIDYGFTTMLAALTELKQAQLTQGLEQLSAQLLKLDNHNRISYTGQSFELRDKSFWQGLQNTDPDNVMTLKKILDLVENGLRNNITFVQAKPIINLLDNYSSTSLGKRLLAANPALQARFKKIEYLYQHQVAATLYNHYSDLLDNINRDSLLKPQDFNTEGHAVKAYLDYAQQLKTYVCQDIVGEFELSPQDSESLNNKKHLKKLNTCTLKTERWLKIMNICQKQHNHHSVDAIITGIEQTGLSLAIARLNNSASLKAHIHADSPRQLTTQYTALSEEKATRTNASYYEQLNSAAKGNQLYFSTQLLTQLMNEGAIKTKRLATSSVYLETLSALDHAKLHIKSKKLQYEDQSLKQTINAQPIHDEIFNQKLRDIADTIEKSTTKNTSALYTIYTRLVKPWRTVVASTQQFLSAKLAPIGSFLSQLGILARATINNYKLSDFKELIANTIGSLKAMLPTSKTYQTSNDLIMKQLNLAPYAKIQQENQDSMRYFLSEIVKKTEHFKPEGIVLTAADERILDKIFGSVENPQKLPDWLTKSSLKQDLAQIFMDMIRADARLAVRLTANQEVMTLLANDEAGKNYINVQLSQQILGLRQTCLPQQLTADIGSTFKLNSENKGQSIADQILANVQRHCTQLTQPTHEAKERMAMPVSTSLSHHTSLSN